MYNVCREVGLVCMNVDSLRNQSQDMDKLLFPSILDQDSNLLDTNKPIAYR